MSVAVVPPEAEEAVDPVAEARGKLKEARTARARAIDALGRAKAASGRARALAADLDAEVERHVAQGKRVTARRREDLKSMLKAGKAPGFEQLAEVPKLAAARAEAESRRDAAKQALEELSHDEQAAGEALRKAEANVAEAVVGVVAAQATGMAHEIIDLEAQAADLHERIGYYADFLAQFVKPKAGSALHHALGGMTFERNGRPMRRSLAHMEGWRAWATALSENPDAELRLIDELAEAERVGLEILSAGRRGCD